MTQNGVYEICYNRKDELKEKAVLDTLHNFYKYYDYLIAYNFGMDAIPA